MSGLTKLETKLLANLESLGRGSLSSVAKRMRRSQQQLSLLMASMKRKGILKGFYPLIDYSRLDKILFRVYLKVSYVDRAKLQKLIDYFKSDENCAFILSCGGRYDLLCGFTFSNASQFNKHFKGLIEEFSNQIRSYTLLTTIVYRVLERTFLGLQRKEARIIGGDVDPLMLGESEKTVLGALSNDGRKALTQIARETGLSPSAVKSSLKSLEKTSVIKGYKPFISLQPAGFSYFIIVIKYHNVSTKLEESLISYLDMHPNVILTVKTLGEWDVEIHAEAQDIKTLRSIETELRERYAVLIHAIESFPVYDLYKIDFVPADM